MSSVVEDCTQQIEALKQKATEMTDGYKQVIQQLMAKRSQEHDEYRSNLQLATAKQASFFNTFHSESVAGVSDIKQCLCAKIEELE